MTVTEKEFEVRLNALPDVYPGFTKSALHILGTRGLVDDIIELLDEVPDATTEDVIAYEWLRCGLVDRIDDNGARVPVLLEWLAMTSGMLDILADMKGKTLKSYQIAVVDGDGLLADRSVRFNLGQHAVDLNCSDFTFELCGKRVELAALLGEKMSLNDDFGPDADAPVRAYAVGERITGVDLVTERIEFDGEEPVDIDMAVAVRTAHSVYTFARESWASTNIRVAVAGELSIPPSVAEIDEEWLREHSELGTAKVTRSIEKLA